MCRRGWGWGVENRLYNCEIWVFCSIPRPQTYLSEMACVHSKTLPHAAAVNQKNKTKQTYCRTAVATLNLNWAQSFVTSRGRACWHTGGSISSNSVEGSFLLRAAGAAVTARLFLEWLQGFPSCCSPSSSSYLLQCWQLMVKVWTALFFFFFLKKISIWFDFLSIYFSVSVLL